MSTMIAILLVGGLVALFVATVVKWVWFVRLRRQADRDHKPVPLNTERAQALRSLAAADYAKFTARRNGRHS